MSGNGSGGSHSVPRVAVALPEKSRRVLLRILQQMREGATGDIRVSLNQGGVRDYVEQRTFATGDLPDGGDRELDTLVDRVTAKS